MIISQQPPGDCSVQLRVSWSDQVLLLSSDVVIVIVMFGFHHCECIVPLVVKNLQCGQFWVRSTATDTDRSISEFQLHLLRRHFHLSFTDTIL